MNGTRVHIAGAHGAEVRALSAAVDAVPCDAVLCDAILCDDMLCHATHAPYLYLYLYVYTLFGAHAQVSSLTSHSFYIPSSLS